MADDTGRLPDAAELRVPEGVLAARFGHEAPVGVADALRDDDDAIAHLLHHGLHLGEEGRFVEGVLREQDQVRGLVLAAAGEAFRSAYGFVPVNHLVCVTQDLAATRPDVVADLVRVFHEATATRPDLPKGRTALGPAIERAIRFCTEQGLLPHPLTLDEVWAGLPPGID